MKWPGKELCFSIIDNYVVACNHLLHVENVNLVTIKKITTTCTSLSDTPAVSRSSIGATTSPATNNKIDSNFVENNYFQFNMRYLPPSKIHLKEFTLANF